MSDPLCSMPADLRATRERMGVRPRTAGLVWRSVALCVALAACGGGGGGGGDAAAPAPSGPAVIQGLELVAVPTTLTLGRSAQLAATATYSDGSTRDVSAEVAWTTPGGAPVEVSAAGEVSAVAEGEGTVTATLDGVSRSATLTVPAVCRFAPGDGDTIVSTAAELRAALLAAGGNGRDDTILVNGGLYVADTTFVYDAHGSTEGLTLRGCNTDEVIFDGRQRQRVFHFQKNGPITDYQNGAVDIYHAPFPSLSVSGLTVRNGNDQFDANMYGRNGGGMLIERYTTELDGVVFTNNRGQYWGGAIAGVGDLTVRASRFSANAATQSASAIEACGSIDMSDTVVEGGNFSANWAGAAVVRTICIEADYSLKPVTVRRSVFRGNGTGLGVIGGYGLSAGPSRLGEVLIEDSVFQDHPMHALDFAGAGNLTVRRTQFLRNGPRRNADLLAQTWSDCTDPTQNCSWGGAVAIRDGIGVHRFENTEFTENRSPNYGGAVFHGGGNCELYALPCTPPADARATEPSFVFVDTVFQRNESHRGAAFSVGRQPGNQGFNFGHVTVIGGAFIDNVATAVPTASGAVPKDGVTTSVLHSGGWLRLCGNPVLSGNVADEVVLALGGLDPGCP